MKTFYNYHFVQFPVGSLLYYLIETLDYANDYIDYTNDYVNNYVKDYVNDYVNDSVKRLLPL